MSEIMKWTKRTAVLGLAAGAGWVGLGAMSGATEGVEGAIRGAKDAAEDIKDIVNGAKGIIDPESKATPPRDIGIKTGKILIVEIKPVGGLEPGSYVKGAVTDSRASMNIKRELLGADWLAFDATEVAKVKDDHAILVDTLIGYDASQSSNLVKVTKEGYSSSRDKLEAMADGQLPPPTLTFTYNSARLFAIQPRVVPQSEMSQGDSERSADAIDCDPDMWRQTFGSKGHCDILVPQIQETALDTFTKVCLEKVWPEIREAQVAAETERLNRAYDMVLESLKDEHTVILKPKLVVKFTDNLPESFKSNLENFRYTEDDQGNSLLIYPHGTKLAVDPNTGKILEDKDDARFILIANNLYLGVNNKNVHFLRRIVDIDGKKIKIDSRIDSTECKVDTDAYGEKIEEKAVSNIKPMTINPAN